MRGKGLACLLALLLGAGALGQRVGVIGDWGFAGPARAQVAALLRLEHAQRPLDALLTLGDNFYPRGKVVEAYLAELPPVPLYPAFGNHDAPALQEELARFGRSRPYYAFGLGPLAFFVLYSEADLAAQRAWLEEALRATRAPYRILVLHRPLYSSGPHGGSPTLRALLGPLLRRYGVGLVLSGHDHLYERLEADGLVQVVAGGGGAPLYAPRARLPFSRALAVVHHALFLEVQGGRLLGYALDLEGRPLDRFALGPAP